MFPKYKRGRDSYLIVRREALSKLFGLKLHPAIYMKYIKPDMTKGAVLYESIGK